MTLKSWSLASCPFKSLVDGSSDLWTQSASGTAEYYYNGGDLTEKPNKVLAGGSGISEETLGGLSAGTWGWGDNDSIGEDTLYVRLSDDTDPDTKGADHVQCSEPLTLLQGASGLECILLSLLISNFSYEDDAQIWAYQTTSADVVRFKWVLIIPVDNSPFALDSKIVLNDQDKIKIMASIEDVAAIASGDES